MMPIYRLSGLLLTVMIAGCAVAPPAPAPVNPAVEERPLAAAAAPVHSPSEVQVMAAVDNENNVFFVLGSSGINAVGRKKVQDHARRLKADPKLEVTLVGYTDDLGSLSYNLAIAEQRVNAIHKELRSNGVRSNQIRRHVAGPEQLSPACRSTECRKKMRRVQFVYAD
ncbi:MAG: OmpA family protein [Azonexus sp.]|jgi:outer membrane protein OmpA-like peptidoglycan-associated protein|nr:OmpA family protein [Azonexus sp.]